MDDVVELGHHELRRIQRPPSTSPPPCTTAIQQECRTDVVVADIVRALVQRDHDEGVNNHRPAIA